MVRLGRRFALLGLAALVLSLGVVSSAHAANMLTTYWPPLTSGIPYSGPVDVPNPNDLLPHYPVTGRANALAFADASSAWAVGLYNIRATVSTTAGLVISTANGGVTWSETTLTAYPTQEFHGVSAPTTSAVWLVGDGGLVLKRGFSDAAWTPQASGVTADLNAVAFADALTGWAVGASGTVLETTDGGATWTKVTSAPVATYRGICALDATHVWIVGSGGTLFYRAGGAWTAGYLGTSNAMRSVSFVDASHGWAVGENRTVRVTTDGGATWSSQAIMAPPLGDGFESPVSVAFSSRLRGIAVGDHEVVWRTGDGGVTWEVDTFYNSAPGNGWGDNFVLNEVRYVPGDPATVFVAGSQDRTRVSPPKAGIFRGGLTFPPAPGAPASAGLKAGASAPSIEVTWTHDGIGTSTYAIERSENGGPFAAAGTVLAPASSWTDTLGGITPARQWGSTWAYRVKAVGAGGESASATTSGLRLDTVAPTVSATVSSPYTSNASITGSAVDTLSGVDFMEWRIDGTSEASGSVATTSALGTHTVQFRAQDVAGNLSDWTTAASFTVVPPPPAAPASAGLKAGASAPSIEVTWTHDGIGTSSYAIERSENGGPFAAAGTVLAPASSWTDALGGMTPARQWGSTWAYRVKAVGPGGESAFATTSGLRLDTVAPTVSATVSSSYTGSASITGSAVDTFSGVDFLEWRIDGTSEASGSVATTSALGTHTVQFRAQDVAGNLSDWTTAASFEVVAADVTAPVTSASVNGTPVAAGAATAWLRSATVTLTSNEFATTSYAIDGAAPVTYASGFGVTPDGAHEVAFRSVDLAGNGETTKTITVRVDTVAPAASATVNSSYVGSASITGTATDTFSGVDFMEWRIDGGAVTSGTVATTSVLGAHTVEFRAQDVAGNLSEWTTAASFEVVAPHSSVPTSTATVAPFTFGSTTFSIVATDAGGSIASIEYALNEVTTTVGAASVSRTVGIGTYTLRHRTTDADGITSEWSAPVSFTVSPIPWPAWASIGRSASRIKFRTSVVLSGVVAPTMPGLGVIVQMRRTKRAKWGSIAVIPFYAVDRTTGYWAWAYRPPRRGTYYLRAVALNPNGTPGAASGQISLSVR